MGDCVPVTHRAPRRTLRIPRKAIVMHHSKLLLAGAVLVVSAAAVLHAAAPAPAQAETCARYYVATGDEVAYGTDADDDGDRNADTAYPKKLLDGPLKLAPTGSGPWCLKNVSFDPTTTDAYVTDKQNGQTSTQQGLGSTYKPTLVTVGLGRQNNGIVQSVTTCLDKIKHHDFIQANVCALAVYANEPAFTKLTKDLSGVLGKYQTLMAGNPKLVVAVPGYYNPYPHATTVATKVPGFCAKLVDTIPTCVARWILLPPALVTLDQVVKKLNTTISAVVQKLAAGNQGRFVYVNTYDEMNDHCMTMKVTIRTKVYHPPSTVDSHDTAETTFGCSTTWIGTDGDDVTSGLEPFTYLPPAVDGIVVVATHDTKELGIDPNDAGHACIQKLVWSAVYQKLGYPANPVPLAKCS
ncbi:MAG: hypothetical protein JWM64_48 [Frankiales bacterium]|nr:hypothetical protein [Frankiales bacterium]